MKTVTSLIAIALCGCCSYGKPVREWSANEWAMCCGTILATGYIAAHEGTRKGTGHQGEPCDPEIGGCIVAPQ